MTKHKFKVEKTELTALVMDEAEFEELCQELSKSGLLDEEALTRIRQTKNVPMVMRGKKTKFLFNKYRVDTELLSACVQGFATKYLDDKIETRELTPELEKKFEDAWASLTATQQQAVLRYIEQTIETLNQKASEEQVATSLLTFVRKMISEQGSGLSHRAKIELTEQIIVSLATTLAMARKTFAPDQLENYLRSYLRRLYIGCIMTIKMLGELN